MKRLNSKILKRMGCLSLASIMVPGAVMSGLTQNVFASAYEEEEEGGNTSDIAMFVEGIQDGSIPADVDACLSRDIDIQGEFWNPSCECIGRFDGYGHVIRNVMRPIQNANMLQHILIFLAL